MKGPLEELNYFEGCLKCNICNSSNLKTSVGYDGITTHPYELAIVCMDCGSYTPIARTVTDREKSIQVKNKINEMKGE